VTSLHYTKVQLVTGGKLKPIVCYHYQTKLKTSNQLSETANGLFGNRL